MDEKERYKKEEDENTPKERRPLFSQEPRSKRMRVTHRVTH